MKYLIRLILALIVIAIYSVCYILDVLFHFKLPPFNIINCFAYRDDQSRERDVSVWEYITGDLGLFQFSQEVRDEEEAIEQPSAAAQDKVGEFNIPWRPPRPRRIPPTGPSPPLPEAFPFKVDFGDAPPLIAPPEKPYFTRFLPIPSGITVSMEQIAGSKYLFYGGWLWEQRWEQGHLPGDGIWVFRPNTMAMACVPMKHCRPAVLCVCSRDMQANEKAFVEYADGRAFEFMVYAVDDVGDFSGRETLRYEPDDYRQGHPRAACFKKVGEVSPGAKWVKMSMSFNEDDIMCVAKDADWFHAQTGDVVMFEKDTPEPGVVVKIRGLCGEFH